MSDRILGHQTDTSLRVPHLKAGAVLAFDYGEKRIGVAVGDADLRIAHPLATIEATQDAKRFAAIAAFIAEWQPALLVVGWPTHLDGAEHEMSKRCRQFARKLENRFKLPTQLVDERLSSRSAELALKESGAARTKTRIDQLAAQQILQSYFDELA
jgi:putative Holliday junction resolvase